jgi:hypothetical protein
MRCRNTTKRQNQFERNEGFGQTNFCGQYRQIIKAQDSTPERLRAILICWAQLHFAQRPQSLIYIQRPLGVALPQSTAKTLRKILEGADPGCGTGAAVICHSSGEVINGRRLLNSRSAKRKGHASDQGVGGSNPLAPTILSPSNSATSCCFP